MVDTNTGKMSGKHNAKKGFTESLRMFSTRELVSYFKKIVSFFSLCCFLIDYFVVVALF